MSSLKLLFMLSLIGACATTGAAQAQDSSPLTWQIMGGYSEPLGRTADYFRGGVALAGGFTYTPRQAPLDFRVELAYSGHSASNQLIEFNQRTTNIEIDDGSGSFWSATGNIAMYHSLGPVAQAYVIGGIGAYHARVELTQTVFFADGYCDSWSGFCDYGYYPGDVVVASNSTTRFGWNAGVGVEFTQRNHSWFIEARYTQIETSTPIRYLPITIGYRF